jgi:hypothetical protein
MDSIPEYVLNDIKKHIQKACTEAELSHLSFAEKEDSITASILTGLRTSKWKGIKDKQWRIEVYTPPTDKRKELSEFKIGADGIIQIAVFNKKGEIEETKGLLFQAKKSIDTHRSKLNEQVEKMEGVAGKGSCAVFVYDEKGYKGITPEELRGKTLNDPNIGRSLNDFIASDFLECRVGKKDLYHSLKSLTLFVPNSRPVRTDQEPLKFILEIEIRNWFSDGMKKILKRKK